MAAVEELVDVRSGILARELARRKGRPQRHRLLQGYPMAPLLERVPAGFDPFARFESDPGRPLIVGVLPHTSCTPKVRGCGFCTFPHEAFALARVRRVVGEVVREIEQAVAGQPWLRSRRVEALYFGGGTASLTPPDLFARLGATLARAFDLEGCEISLEGVPRHFLLHDAAMLDALGRVPARHRRISMGVQTFDGEWLRRMGREAFGDAAEIRALVAEAHRRAFTASADLLVNLPGAPPALALADARTACELGFDQVCLYNLVLTEGLGSEWSKDPELVGAMPDPAVACENWLAARDLLLERGWVQTTLTNFERAEVAGGPRRFVYESASFDPGVWDGIGFGPGAISTFTDRSREHALKWTNEAASEAYANAVAGRGSAVGAAFEYEPIDLRLLHLTRQFSRTWIDRAAYGAFFGSDPVEDFAPHFAALAADGLVAVGPERIGLTPEGMFYADSVAGLLAHERVEVLRGGGARNDLRGLQQPMG